MLTTLCAFCLIPSDAACAQANGDRLTPNQLISLSEAQVDEFIRKADDEGLPSPSIAALAFLLLNREGLVLPKIVERLRSALENPAKPGDTVVKLEGLLAYLGTPAALEALLDLETDYALRVERLLPMMLSYSTARGNSFDLAYRVMDRGGDYSRRAVTRWVGERSTNERYYAEWAAAFLRHNGGDSTGSAVAIDPFASRLNVLAQSTFKAAVELEARHQVERRQK
jgi:hypothetical protein